MCCKKDCNDNWYFEQNAIRNCITLAEQIINIELPVENVLRHYNVTSKICPEPYISLYISDIRSIISTGGK